MLSRLSSSGLALAAVSDAATARNLHPPRQQSPPPPTPPPHTQSCTRDLPLLHVSLPPTATPAATHWRSWACLCRCCSRPCLACLAWAHGTPPGSDSCCCCPSPVGGSDVGAVQRAATGRQRGTSVEAALAPHVLQQQQDNHNPTTHPTHAAALGSPPTFSVSGRNAGLCR